MRKFLLPLVAILLSTGASASSYYYSGIKNISLTAAMPNVYYTTTVHTLNQFYGTDHDNLILDTHRGTNAPVRGSTRGRYDSRVRVAFDTLTGYVDNYSFGEDITGEFDTEIHYFFRNFENGGVLEGEFVNTSGYAGLSFTDENDDVFYGWAQIVVSGADPLGLTAHTITVVDWAYSLTPGHRLQAGRVPVPAAIWLFASGLPLLLWRGRRKFTGN